MLHLTSSCRYFYYNGFADMRKGAYSLSELVRNEMHLNVLSGDVFIFIGRRASKIKLLQWDTAPGFHYMKKDWKNALSKGHATIARPPIFY